MQLAGEGRNASDATVAGGGQMKSVLRRHAASSLPEETPSGHKQRSQKRQNNVLLLKLEISEVAQENSSHTSKECGFLQPIHLQAGQQVWAGRCWMLGVAWRKFLCAQTVIFGESSYQDCRGSFGGNACRPGRIQTRSNLPCACQQWLVSCHGATLTGPQLSSDRSVEGLTPGAVA